MIKIKSKNKVLIIFLIILIIIYILIKTDFISKAQDDILFLKFLNLQSNNSEISSSKEIINSKVSKYEKATYIFEMKSDANGIFQIGAGTENFKRSETALTNDFDFNTDSALLIVDKAKEGNPYWKGNLQATFENNIIKINGTLTEVK